MTIASSQMMRRRLLCVFNISRAVGLASFRSTVMGLAACSTLSLLQIFAVLTASGCGQSADSTVVDAGGDVAEIATADVVSVDGAAKDSVFIFGVNTTGKSTPEHFKPLAEGAEIKVELGPQGLWMVVLAFRTNNLLKPPLVLGGRVEMEGELLGELKLAKQKLLPGPKNYYYYYNFFLVVAPEGVAGKKATISFTVTDTEGPKVALVHPVVLTGGK